jgi:hypothetical protein
MRKDKSNEKKEKKNPNKSQTNNVANKMPGGGILDAP